MFEYKQILDVLGRKILDSRGYPAIEAEVLADDGAVGRASAPFFIEQEDIPFARGCGYEYRQLMELAASEAVHHINTMLADAVIGENVLQQSHIDRILLRAEGDGIKEEFCRRAVLAVSLAAARTAAECLGMPLYRYLGGTRIDRMPVLQMRFDGRRFDRASTERIPEIYVSPAKEMNFRSAVKMGTVGFMQYQKNQNENLREENSTHRESKPDPSETDQKIQVKGNLRQYLKDIVRAFEETGYRPGADYTFALKISEDFAKQMTKDAEGFPACLRELCSEYPVFCLEAPFPSEKKAYVLDVLKADTVTGLMKQANKAHTEMQRICVDATERKTEDPISEDLALALEADWIRLGAPGDPAYTAGYNQLLRISGAM